MGAVSSVVCGKADDFAAIISQVGLGLITSHFRKLGMDAAFLAAASDSDIDMETIAEFGRILDQYYSSDVSGSRSSLTALYRLESQEN